MKGANQQIVAPEKTKSRKRSVARKILREISAGMPLSPRHFRNKVAQFWLVPNSAVRKKN